MARQTGRRASEQLQPSSPEGMNQRCDPGADRDPRHFQKENPVKRLEQTPVLRPEPPLDARLVLRSARRRILGALPPASPAPRSPCPCCKSKSNRLSSPVWPSPIPPAFR